MRAGDVDENASMWTVDSPPGVASPPLSGTKHADVVVVGGGLTGVSTAWHLAQRFPGRGIVLLEARRIGNGASGRNGGQVLNWINGVPSTEPEATRRIFDFTRGGIDLIERLAREHAPDARFSRNGCLEVCTSAARAERAHADVERLRGFGLPLRWLPGSEVGLGGVHGAVLDPTAGQVSSLALLRGWMRALLASGVTVYEDTPVVRIEEGSTVRITTRDGEVRAAALVLATNAYTPSLGYFTSGILPLHARVVATDILPRERWRASGLDPYDGFSDDLDRIAYGCRTGTGRLVFGGGSNAAYRYLYGGDPVLREPSDKAVRGFAAVEATLARYFPRLASSSTITSGKPLARWSGPLAITFDRVCSMGVGGAARNVYHALGYSGHGIVLGMLAGRVLTDLYAGDHEAWRAFPFYQRRLPRIPPEPLRWIGYQAYTRATGRSPRRS